MKKIKFILPLILVFFSCSSDSVQTPENTKIELTILEENNLPVDNIEVKLYTTQNDLDNNTNVLQTLNTNANGKVTFDNLQPITYFWKTNGNCYYNNSGSSINPITDNATNPYILDIQTYFQGKIVIVNNSSNEYSFILTGPSIHTDNIAAGAQYTLGNWAVGTYTLQYTQVGGSTTNTTTFVLDCGEIENFSIN